MKVFSDTAATGLTAYAQPYGLAADSADDLIIGGAFQSNIDFGGGALVPPAGKTKAGFVVSLDGTNGSHRWSSVAQPSGQTDVVPVFFAPDALGKISFGTGWSGLATNGDIGSGVLLGKYDSTGATVWSHQSVAPSAGAYVQENALGSDAAGSSYAALLIKNDALPGGGSAALSGTYFVKYDATGTLQVSKQLTDPVGAVVFNRSGEAFVLRQTVQPADTVSKLDNAGNIVWSKTVGLGTLAAARLTADPTGNLFLAVPFPAQSAVSLGSTTVSGPNNTNASSVALFKLDTNGNVLWGHAFSQIGGTSLGFSLAATDGLGDYYFACAISGTNADFGGGTMATGYYLVKLTPAGVFQWEIATKSLAFVMAGARSTGELFMASNDTKLDLGTGPVFATTGFAVAKIGP